MADEPTNPPSPGEPTPNQEPNPGAADPQKPQTNSDWYFKRQAEKAQKERDDLKEELANLQAKIQEFENANLTEAQRKDAELENYKLKATELERDNARLLAIHEAGLPPELAKLVPKGIEDPAGYIQENLIPLRDKIASPMQVGNPTNPPRDVPPDEDELALQTYEKMKSQNMPQKQIDAFWFANHERVKRAMARKQG